MLAAAAEGTPAYEGYEGHGLFTWAVLDALKNGDRNGNGFIELVARTGSGPAHCRQAQRQWPSRRCCARLNR